MEDRARRFMDVIGDYYCILGQEYIYIYIKSYQFVVSFSLFS